MFRSTARGTIAVAAVTLVALCAQTTQAQCGGYYTPTYSSYSYSYGGSYGCSPRIVVPLTCYAPSYSTYYTPSYSTCYTPNYSSCYTPSYSSYAPVYRAPVVYRQPSYGYSFNYRSHSSGDRHHGSHSRHGRRG